MKYQLVNNESELNAVKTDVVQHAKKRFEKDRFNGYASYEVYITDKVLAKNLWEEIYGKSYSFKSNTDSKIRIKTEKVRIKTVWHAEIYCNYSNGMRSAKVCNISAPITLVIYKNVMFCPSFFSSAKAADFFLFNDDTNYETIQYDEEWEKTPNRMSVITDSGIEKWYQYLTSKRSAAMAKADDYARKWDAYKKRILDFAKESNMPLSHQRDGNYCYIYGNNGSIRKNGIILNFSFSPDNGNIREELKLDFYTRGVDAFIKLSDNKYDDNK